MMTIAMNERTQRLKTIMRKHRLKPEQVGKLLNRSTMTVRIWCCETDSSKTIPDHSLQLLELKTEQHQSA